MKAMQAKGRGKRTRVPRTVKKLAAAQKIRKSIGKFPASMKRESAARRPATDIRKDVAQEIGKSIGKLPASTKQKAAARNTGKSPEPFGLENVKLR